MNRLIYLSIFFLFLACKDKPEVSPKIDTYTKLSGITMGVIKYNITYKDKLNRSLKPSIDSLLNDLNMGTSTYEKKSIISQFNQSQQGITVENTGYARHFIKNILIAKEIVKKTNGFFDPTVAPLVNYYGFGTTGKKGVQIIDTAKVMKALTLVGFDKIIIKKKIIIQFLKQTQVFNSILVPLQKAMQ